MTKFVKPVLGASQTSPFGMRNGVPHQGVDLAAGNGTPIRAVAAGTVEFAAWNNGYGNYVRIDHGGGLKTAYAHQSRIITKRGLRVAQGQVIGLVGSTGDSTGPHLHFEVHVGGKQVDPAPYLGGKQVAVKNVAGKGDGWDLDPGAGTGIPGGADDAIRDLAGTVGKSASWLSANWSRVLIVVGGGMLLLAGVFFFVWNSPAGQTTVKAAKTVRRVAKSGVVKEIANG